MKLANGHINIYTDGSCHTQLHIGSWVAIIFIQEEKTILSGIVLNTTHQRMEILAVIEAIKYIISRFHKSILINIVSDSQYVIDLPRRKQKLLAKNFVTNKGNDIANLDLVKTFYALVENVVVIFKKTKAHQQNTDVPNYNIDADKLSRKLVREAVLNTPLQIE